MSCSPDSSLQYIRPTYRLGISTRTNISKSAATPRLSVLLRYPTLCSTHPLPRRTRIPRRRAAVTLPPVRPRAGNAVPSLAACGRCGLSCGNIGLCFFPVRLPPLAGRAFRRCFGLGFLVLLRWPRLPRRWGRRRAREGVENRRAIATGYRDLGGYGARNVTEEGLRRLVPARRSLVKLLLCQRCTEHASSSRRE